MAQLPVNQLSTQVKELHLGDAKVYHLPNWHGMSHPERLAVIRQLAEMRGRDPRIAKLALSIIRKSRARPRQYKQQAAALLKWVQDPKNVYYVNEPGERLQDPIYTVQVKHGDCDDQVALLCALFETVALPWRLCLAGRNNTTKQKVRYIEGEAVPPDTTWAHIYCMVGAPPFTPNVWWFCETTIQGVPLGWDVINGDSSYLPELGALRGPSRIELAGPRMGSRARVPPPSQRSPAWEAAQDFSGAPFYSALIGAEVGASMDEEPITASRKNFWRDQIAQPVLVGTIIAIISSVLIPLFSPIVPAIQSKIGVKKSCKCEEP